jgi:hypothetical protein
VVFSVVAGCLDKKDADQMEQTINQLMR